MAAGPRSRTVLEIIIVGGAAAAALFIQQSRVTGRLPGLGVWLVPAAFLYVPMIAVLAGDRDFRALGLDSPEWKKAGLDLAVFAGVILPVFLVSWWALWKYGLGVRFSARPPAAAGSLVLWQLLAVALPEEVFFRGFLQERLNRLMGRGLRFAGADIGPGLFIAAALFALAHFAVVPRPASLLVFFPAMLFGYYRERSNSVFVSVLAHALANVTFLTVQSWVA